ncbi:MAG: efflux RND transporter permease subunit [Galactobacter sp.]
MSLLSRFALRNRALIVLLCLFLVVFGSLGMTKLKQELIPSVEFPQITVTASNQGATPEVMDKQVGQPLESSLQAVEGLEESTATSVAGMTTLNLTFGYGTDLDRARNQVDRALSNASQALPSGVEPVSFAGSVDDLPVIYYAVSGKDSLAATASSLEDEVAPALRKLDGVRQVDVTGAASQQLQILPDTKDLTAAGLSPNDLKTAVEEAGVAMSLGDLEDQKLTLPIQTSGAPQSVDDIEALPLAKKDGSTTSVGALAEVKVTDQESSSITRTNGEQTLALSVTKTPEADTVRVSEAVRDALPSLQKASGTTFTLVFDQAPAITDSIHDLTEEGLLGLIFAIVVILLFLLSVRSTLVTAVSIPLSLLVTFIGLWAAGFSLNMLTLGALTISIGRVVDDSIVVIENIKRHLTDPLPRGQSILVAVREVAGAITASTLTTVAVFLPVAFVGDLAGELFRPFAVTVAIAMLSSLFVALTIVPVLAYWFLRAPKVMRTPKNMTPAIASEAAVSEATVSEAAPAAGDESAKLGAEASGTDPASAETTGSAKARKQRTHGEKLPLLQRLYLPVLTGTQNHPVLTVIASVIVLGATLGATPLMKTNLLGNMGQEAFSGTLTMPAGSSLTTTDEAAAKLEKELTDLKDVKDVQVSIGSGDGAMAMLMGGGSGTAQFTVTTEEGTDPTKVARAAQRAAEKLDTGGEPEFSATQGGGFSNDITVAVKASDPDALKQADAAVVKAMKNVDGVNEVTSDLTTTSPQVRVSVDREKAAKAGLSQAQIAGLVNATLNPLDAGQVTFGFTTLPVKIGEGQSLSGLSSLEDLEITTAQGQIPLSDIATVKREDAEASLSTQNTDRISTVTITPPEDDLGTVAGAVTSALDSLDLPNGASATLGGAATQQADAFSQLGLALLAAIAIVYVVMVATFKSLIQPLILLVSIPFAATGALAALLISGTPLGLASLIGLLMLVGIVVTNAIVLIDLINQYRRPGPGHAAMPLAEAIKFGALRRLRPILMTAAATIFAMIPMALGITGSGGVISQPLAVVVIGGLVSSTLLTLLLVPVLYRLVEIRKERRRVADGDPVVELIDFPADLDAEVGSTSGSAPAKVGRHSA